MGSLPCRARLQALTMQSPIRQTICGARSYARTSESLRASPLQPNPFRPVLQTTIQSDAVQKRGITQKYLKRVKDAEKEWEGFAEEIKAGKRQNFVQFLEERGLIHDVVG